MIRFLDLQSTTNLHIDEYRDAINEVLSSGWYLQGRQNALFESNYSQYIGTQYCIGCANGLDALWLIFRAYKELGVLQDGDEIIVPANTYIATILAITENNLKPILIEPHWDTLQIDDTLIEERISERTRAICIVHLYGRCAYTPKIASLCEKYNLKLVEDNAQAHGCIYEGRKTGSLGNASGHSFYPGKNLGALGDGGAVTTDDIELSEAIRYLANYGSSKKYVFKYHGRNSRLDEIQAAILNVKLKYLDENNQYRRKVAKRYYDGITNVLFSLPTQLENDNNVYHLFPILSKKRDDVQKYLKQKGIETLIHYPIPPHKQECYREWNEYSFPITERIAQCELSLPIGLTINDSEIEYVVNAINEYHG